MTSSTNPLRVPAPTGALPLQPLTAAAAGCVLWMGGSILVRASRRCGLLACTDEVCLGVKRVCRALTRCRI